MVVQAIEHEHLKMSSLKKFNYFFKIVLRAFLIAVFIILLALFGLIGICYVDSLYNVKNNIDKNPLFGAYVIVTESMIPTIKVNDAIVIKRVEEDNIEIGDIITFVSNDKYYQGLIITHRVVGKQLDVDGKYIYRTKGDNNSLEDTALVSFSNIYGKVVLKIPKVGYIQRFVYSGFGFVVSIIVPVLLVIIYEIWRIRKVIKIRDAEIEIL